MSKACYNCPYNLTDCYRPDCIATDGVKRPLTVINRMLPGPNVEVFIIIITQSYFTLYFTINS